MLKQLKSVSMMLFLMGVSTGAAYAAADPGVADVKITQQSGNCTGVVKDAAGEPIIGASVVVSGTTNGTLTGIDGDFSFGNVKNGDVIEISYVGYKTQKVTWNGKALVVTLKEDTELLEEVVVVGYGTQKKTNLTGSVSMVDSDVLESRPVQNVGQALQGVVPGLNFSVNNNGGELNNKLEFNIRGAGSIGQGSSAAPLVLIDGIEGDMNTVNPDDIANISVLKDAASASIYGARASFGVIMITTKKGSAGKTNVNYSANVRFSKATQIPNMLDSEDFANYFNAAAANAGQSPVYSEEVMQRIRDYKAGKIDYGTVPNPNNREWMKYGGANANTDWFAEMYKEWVPSHQHNLSVSGGNDRLTYRVSGSFMNQNGLIRHGKDKFNRYTVDSKISAKITDWLTLNYANKWTREDYSRPSYLSPLFFHNIARRWPSNPVRDPNGYLMHDMEIIQLEDAGVAENQNDYYTQQLGLVFEPIKDWHINVEGNLRSDHRSAHSEVLPFYGHDQNGEPFLLQWNTYPKGYSEISESQNKRDYFTTNIYSDFSKTIGDHYFKVMAGFNAELTKVRKTSGSGQGLNDASTPWLDQTTTEKRAYGGRDHTAIAGFFGRINYTYKDRYMVEVNGRYDGSSRFVGSKRWGFFPSFSLGWNIAREEFFKNLTDEFTTLKLRGSWGQLGNSNTNNWYPFYQTMPTSAMSGRWLVNDQRQNTASMPGMISTALTWETVESWDIGLDWGVFNNRLTGSFDYYQRSTKDMVGPAPVLPSVLGTGVPRINNCDMKTTGWELEVNWRDQIEDFSYGVKFVLSDATSEVTRYPNDNWDLGQYYDGYKLGQIWGYTTEGIANSQEEMDAHLAKNKPSWGSNWQAGDIMYKDLNGDGKVNSGANTLQDPGDRRIIGNSTPRYNFGLTIDAAWKGFDFSMFWQGTAKRDVWLSGMYFWGATGGLWQSSGFKEHLDYWRPEGDKFFGENMDAYYPRANFDGGKNQYTQTRYLQDASYIRMKNIQLGYTLPKAWVNKAGLGNVRVYLSGDNLLTFTDILNVFDPEAIGGGWGNGRLYPLQKNISVGLNVNF